MSFRPNRLGQGVQELFREATPRHLVKSGQLLARFRRPRSLPRLVYRG